MKISSLRFYIAAFAVLLASFQFLTPATAGSNLVYIEDIDTVIEAEPREAFVKNLPVALDELFASQQDSWGGAYFDGTTIKIGYFDQSAEEAETAILQIGLNTEFELFKAESSYRALNNAYETVLYSGKPEITAVGISYSRSALLVGTSELTNEIATFLNSISPVDVIAYHLASAIQTSSRYYDLNPFSGGSLFLSRSSTQPDVESRCSFGFAINAPSVSQPLLVTAGHCKTYAYKPDSVNKPDSVLYRINADQVFRKDPGTLASITDDVAYQIGSFTSGSLLFKEPTDGNYIISNVTGRTGDWAVAALSPTNSGPRSTLPEIYVGLGDTTSKKVVSTSFSESWLIANPTTLLYGSGASSYISGEPVVGGFSMGRYKMTSIYPFPGVQIYFNYSTNVHMYISGLWVGEDSGNGPCSTLGDSGGPVYRNLSDGTVAAVGITSGRGPSGNTCKNYFTPISDVLNQFGGSIKVGS
jgi:hypothetical protein